MNAISEIIQLRSAKKLISSAAKFPMIFLLLGLISIGLSYIDDFCPTPECKTIFALTDKIASIFFAFAIVTFFYNILIFLCQKYEKRLIEKHAVAALILSSVRKALRIIFILIAINLVILLVGTNKFYLIIANNVINTIIIGSIGWIAVQILCTGEAILYQYMMTLTRRENIRVKALYTKLHIIRNITTVIIIIVTAAAILMTFSSVRNIGISILASAGFLTAIIGLSAQKTLFTLFSGLQIALSQTIKIGDVVVFDSTSGIVEEITFTYVTLKLADARRLIVPINNFIDKPFENCSREDDGMRSSLLLYVDYMLPIEPLRAALKNVLSQSSFWDKKVCKLEVSNLNERSVEIRVQVSAANADDLSDLRAEVREKLLTFIRTNYPDYFPKVRFNGAVP